MKRITACFLTLLFLCTALVPMAVHADAMDQKLQEELSSINFWFEAYFGEDAELTYCKWLANEITWEFWDGLADEDDYYIDVPSENVREYLKWRCGENTGEGIFAAAKGNALSSGYEGFEYDAETDTFRFYSGGFGGFGYNRIYRGYVKDDNRYCVFYADTVKVYIYDLYYNGEISEEEYNNAVDTGVFNGHEVLCEMGDYYYVDEVKNNGICYYVQFAKDGHTVIDLPQYVNASDFPEEFDHDGIAILSQPKSVEIANGKTASVTVVPDGEGFTYKWYYKDKGMSAFKLTTTFTGNTYSVAMNAARNGRQVYCVITDADGCTAKSDVATLSLLDTSKTAAQLRKEVGSLNFWADHYLNGTPEQIYYKFMIEDVMFNCDGTMDDEGYVHVDGSVVLDYMVGRAGEDLAFQVWEAYYTNSVPGVEFDAENWEIIAFPAAFGGGINNRVYRGFTQESADTYRVYYADREIVILDYLLWDGEITEAEYNAAVKRGSYEGYALVSHWDEFWYYVKDVKNSGIFYTVKYDDDCVLLGLPEYYTQEDLPAFDYEALKITGQPQSVQAAYGKTATVTVSAEGEGLTYQWYYKDRGASSFTLTNSFKGASYSVEMTAARAGREVYCVVTDETGNSQTTKVATLTMKASITAQPKSVQAAKGKTAKVTVSAEGEGLTYKWYYKDKGSKKFTRTTAFKGASYSVQMTAARSGRQVYCVVTDKYGNTVTTKIVTLSMKARIATQPKSVTVAKNKTAKVTVKAEGEGLKYTWYVKNAGATKFTKSSVKTASYAAKMTSSSANRQVYCKVTDKFGNTVASKTVSMKMK